MKVKNWDGTDLAGEWLVTDKLDGVQVVVKNGEKLSRAGKPLYNLPDVEDGIYEVYLGSWEDTVSAVRTHAGDTVPASCLYALYPKVDRALHRDFVPDPTKAVIEGLLADALAEGFEGLVGGQGETWLKVKPKETHDVRVFGLEPGKGRHLGRIGALVTPMGKVGTGLTDAQREYSNHYVGKIIEVECMGLTPNGKFRHPRFLRVRWDKS
jgi:hypothetical protein